ncbi:MAG: MarR family transcriptional regulator [Ruminococcus sp.]|nr:MarR family transcriptional regulator [Ruminococcus sp.]
MKETLHYLLMSVHLSFQKKLLSSIKKTDLTPGQPKIIDYLTYHDGAVQKEIADACHIEPATITSVLLGMEKNGLIIRKNLNGNRRNLYVYLTDKGKNASKQVAEYFDMIEKTALNGFNADEREMLISLLTRMNNNINIKEVIDNE